NNPSTGWYIAEDTGGAFTGKCKIDVFMGVGKQGVLGSPNPTVSATDQSKWPEVWVFPGTKTDDLWDDNIVTYAQGKPATGLQPGQGGVPASATTTTSPVASDATKSYAPTHPYFSVPYSVNPSFSTSIPYDFSVYDTIPKQLSKLERCKDDIDCIIGNVTEIENSDASYDWIVKYGGNVLTKDKEGNVELPAWEAFCEKPDQHAVNSITEALEVCARSTDTDCICSNTLPVVSSEEVNKFYGRAFSSYLSIISPVLGLISFAATELSESRSWNERTIGFLQSGKNIRVFMRAPGTANPQEVATANFKEVASGLRGYTDNEMKYKITDTDKSIDIYKDKSSNLTIYPSGSAPSKTKCELHSKVLKFCIAQNKTFFAYNSQDNRMGLQQLVLKFAYVFRSKASDVKGFNVYDAKLAANTSLLVWDEASGIDASYYTLYYSENSGMSANLASQNPAELDETLKSDLVSVKLDVSSRQDVRIDTTFHLSDPVCSFLQGLVCDRTYQLDTATGGEPYVALSGKVLYYSTLDKKYFYFLSGIRDDHKYFYGLTVTDTSGSESPSFNAPESQQESKDDIPPGIASILPTPIDTSSNEVVVLASPIVKKIDNSDMASAVSKIKLYCFDGSVSEPDTTGKSGIYAKVQSVDENTIRLTASLADFNSYNCGFSQPTPSGLTAKVVAVGVQTVQGVDMEYTGKLPSDALSDSFSVPESS
ncbi:hypothetical protein KY363_07140, partial [Candidatus Woesearchaeota archaeon]|nr:hypothetical protein [Candidatus Woesearchaeota archaeon]